MNNEVTDIHARLSEISGHVENYSEWPEIPFEIKKEGNIEFRIAKSDTIYDAPAFYNPLMVLNRDLSILFAQLYSIKKEVKIRIIDPLGGIGIRALRLAYELKENVSEIVINDFNDISSRIGQYNIKQLGLTDKIIHFKREARALLYNLAEKQLRYHYLDLDPFGPPSPFIDSIWQILPNSGLVSVTATDMTALCGVYPKSCLRKYGSIPLNNFHTHETAARILISMTVRSAARNGYGAIPIFSASVDHYTKIFFICKKGRGDANETTSKIGYSYTCKECDKITYLPGLISDYTCCEETDIAGPLWTGDLFNGEWCKDAIELLHKHDISTFENKDTDPGEEIVNKFPSIRRLKKILREGIASSGLQGYYTMDVIGKKLKLTQPKFEIFKARLEKKGFRIVRSEFTKQAFRTDAPMDMIYSAFKSQ